MRPKSQDYLQDPLSPFFRGRGKGEGVKWTKSFSAALFIWLVVSGPVFAESAVDELLDRPIGSQAAHFSLELTTTSLEDKQHAMAPQSREVKAERILVSSTDQGSLSLKWLRFAVDGTVVKIVPSVSLPYAITWDFSPLGEGSHEVEVEVFTDSGRLGYGRVVVRV